MKRRVIYQILTDRFADSRGHVLKGLSASGPAWKWQQFAGGSWQGVAARLSYLRRLGVGAVWLSPVYENSWLPEERGKQRRDGYHGYWISDFFRADPRWGQEADLAALLAALKQHDITPVMDVVLNHTSPTYSAHRGGLWKYGESFAQYRNDHDHSFHHLGDLDQSRPYDPYMWENANLWGLADLAQENPRIERYLRDASLKWLRLGFEGVRLDTALHMPATYIARWTHDMKKGAPHCRHFFGEWWNGGAHDPVSSRYSRQTGMHLTDFGLATAWRKVLCGVERVDSLALWVLMQDRFLDPDLKVNFLDNHDIPRLMNRLVDCGFPLHSALARRELGLVLLLMWRGVPCVYYGTENGLFTRRRPRGKGWGEDPYNREPMRFPRTDTPGIEILRKFCRWRRESDLVEHPLSWSSHEGRRVIRRGPLTLTMWVNAGNVLTGASLQWQGATEWERLLR